MANRSQTYPRIESGKIPQERDDPPKEYPNTLEPPWQSWDQDFESKTHIRFQDNEMG